MVASGKTHDRAIDETPDVEVVGGLLSHGVNPPGGHERTPSHHSLPRRHDVLATGAIEIEPLAFAVLGHHDDAGPYGRRNFSARQRSSLKHHVADVGAVDSGDCTDDFGAASTDEPGDAEDLAAGHGEVDVLEGAVTAQTAHLQDNIVRRRGWRVMVEREVATDHGADHILL